MRLEIEEVLSVSQFMCIKGYDLGLFVSFMSVNHGKYLRTALKCPSRAIIYKGVSV
jgi:hypothetical protein